MINHKEFTQQIHALPLPPSDYEELFTRAHADSLNLSLIPAKRLNTASTLRAQFPGGRLYACDFYIENIEDHRSMAFGYAHEEIPLINIDHHAPASRMYQHISSGNLALEFLKEHPAIAEEDSLVLNHTDCDSILTGLLMRGLLPAEQHFGEIVLAADHTGRYHPLADLLQSLYEQRDIGLSVRNLARALTGQTLEEKAWNLFLHRLSQREATRQLIHGQNIRCKGDVAVVPYHPDLYNPLLPSLLPEAALIVIVGKPGPTSTTTTTGMRLGLNAKHGMTLFDLDITGTIDPNFGGRWNAGANARGGGSSMHSEEYVERIVHAVQQWKLKGLHFPEREKAA